MYIITFSMPYFFICILLLLICNFVIRIKYKKSYTYLFFFSIFGIYMINVLKYTQFPIVIQSDYRTSIGTILSDVNLFDFDIHFNNLKQLLLNILLTIPFGFGLPFIKKIKFTGMFIIGIILCVIIELLQLIINFIIGYSFRIVDIVDFFANLLGVVLGYIILKGFKIVFNKFITKLDEPLTPFLNYIYTSLNCSKD